MKIKNGLMGVLGGIAVIAGLTGEAEAGTVYLKNNSSSSSVAKEEFYTKNLSGSDQNYGFGDVSYLASPNTPRLLVYGFTDDNVKVNTNAYPVNTKGWSNIILGVDGTFTGNNYIRYNVMDTTDLEDPYQLVLSDSINPSNKTTLIKDNAYHNINLNDLNVVTGVYDTLTLDRDLVVGTDGNYSLDDVVARHVNVSDNGILTTGAINSDYVSVTGTGSLSANSINTGTLTIGGPTGLANSVPEPSTIALLAMAGLIGGYFAMESYVASSRDKKKE